MATGGVISNNGKNAVWKRAYGTSVTAASRFRIGTGTNTPDVTDTALQTPIAGWTDPGAADYKDFLAGYPTYDTTNKRVTIRGYISTTEANGNTITECGEYNTDGTPLLYSRDVFTGISKSASVSIIIQWIHEFV